MNDIFQVDYMPDEKKIKINLPEEVWRNIDTIIMTRQFKKNWSLRNKKKARSNAMPKAILELEMPENCWDCPLQAISTEKKIRYCTVMRYVTEHYGTKRRENCPLKPVEDKEV